MFLEIGLGVSIGLLSMSVFELVYGVEGVDALWIIDYIHAFLCIMVSGTQIETGCVTWIRLLSLVDIVAASRAVKAV